MIGFMFEIFTAIICIGLVSFFCIAFFYHFISELLSLDKSRNINPDVWSGSSRSELETDYQLRKMNETLTRNRNDSLTKSDHYGGKDEG